MIPAQHSYPQRETLGSFELRTPRTSDLESVSRIQADPETNIVNPSGPPSADECERQLTGWILDWERDAIGYWAVVRPSAGEIVGIGGIRLTEDILLGPPVFNLYYRFTPRVWGQGLATDVSACAIRSLKNAGIEGIVSAVIHDDNIPSQRVAHRAGLEFYDRVAHKGGTRQRWIIQT